MSQFQRYFDLCELRSLPNEPDRISGIGSVFYDGTPATEYKLGPNVIERVHAGAFDKFLESRSECVALYDHNPQRLLAKRSSGTLQLEKTSRGLGYSFQIDPADQDHQYVLAKMKRGDVRGSSVGFVVLPGGEQFTREGSNIIRNLRSLAIGDVGPTWKPCYEATTAELRSLSDLAEKALIEPPLPIEFWRR